MIYESFEPTDERDFTLIVHNGLAYRDTLPDNTERAEAILLLQDAKALVETDTVNHGYVKQRGYTGSAMLDALRETKSSKYMVFAYDRGYWSAMDALQLAMEGWITLESDSSRHRGVQQEGGIVAFTDQEDTTTEMVLATFDEAIELLRK